MLNLKYFEDFKRIYFIGIGGISISALSVIMKSAGFEVSGSDAVKSELTKKLENLGIIVNYKHLAKNISQFLPDLVVYSGAIKNNNPELIEAKKQGVLCLERADFLGKFTKCFENVVAISGTHGKTTTTSMLSEIFVLAGLNPTVHIGGESLNLNGNFVVGNNKFLITEACEYRRSFLKFKTDVGVVLNVEEDHPDCYKSYQEVYGAFSSFLEQSKIGIVIGDINFTTQTQIITFNFNDANFTVKNIKKSNFGYKFSVYKNNVFLKRFELNVFGKHNILNALACIVVSDYFKIDMQIVKTALKNFKGIKRRFEPIENKLNVPVFADYAHHPTEIKKLISEVKSLNKPIICVFQPHTYSRTKQYFEKFCECFNGCYQVVIYKTYSARENKIVGADAKTLYLRLKSLGENVFYYNNFSQIFKHLKKYTKSNCIVLIVGAGDIYNIKERL